MKYESIEFTLKDGRTATLRCADENDARDAIEYLNTMCSETEYVLLYPEELKDDVEGEKQYIKSIVDSENSLMIVCTVDGEYAGNCHIKFRGAMKLKHTAEIAVGLKEKFCHLGIGIKMFEEIERIARERKDTEILTLEVISDNDRAIGLYRKAGFEICGRIPNAIKFKNGTYNDLVTMYKKL